MNQSYYKMSIERIVNLSRIKMNKTIEDAEEAKPDFLGCVLDITSDSTNPEASPKGNRKVIL